MLTLDGLAEALPTATVALDTEASGCESGRLRVTTAGTTGERQFRRASWSDATSADVTLFQDERITATPTFAGAIDYPFVAGPVPFGIVVTLYGYQGSTPPTAETTVEYAVSYVCDTLDIVSSKAGPYGTIAHASVPNYEGLWWRSPPGSESGWGINLAHQGDVIFATWFTYDSASKPWWLSMTALRTGEASYAGLLYETHGPAWGAPTFDPRTVTARAVGQGSLVFSDADSGIFAYTVDGVSQAKPITRQVFGPMPSCVFGASADLAQASNYQDLWYAAPAESEAGWGINFTHQGDIIFATWFSYDMSGAPLWLSAVLPKTAAGVYAGTVNRTDGPAFDSVPFDAGRVRATTVGNASVRFADGNAAIFAYAVALEPASATVVRTKAITREVFRAPGTVCH